MNVSYNTPKGDKVDHLRQPIIAEMAKQIHESIRGELPQYSNLTISEFERALARRYDSMFDVPEHKRFDTSGDSVQMHRAFVNSAALTETFSTVVGDALIQATDAEPDSTEGWVKETDAVNFLPATAFTVEQAARLEPTAKNKRAVSTSFGTKGQSWAVARYAGQFTVDEQDILNGVHVGAVLTAAAEQGAAAARVRPDLVYALSLNNPTLTADNVVLFHTSHGNKATGGSSALSATSLDTGIEKIGMQHLTDLQSTGEPVHSNLQAKYLLLPPALVGAGRRAVRNMVLGDGNDIVVRQESRLSTLGVVDPKSGTFVTNSAGATNWLLTAKASSLPSILIGGLNGSLKPKLRRFNLDAGEWGIGWDIVLDLGAAAVDYRGVYYAVGA